MYMPYSKNPHLPRVRREAVRLVRSGWTQSKVARHLGYLQGTISKWVKKAPGDGRRVIPTKSSRPHAHPKALAQGLVDAIVAKREEHGRCAVVVHRELAMANIAVSLSSVKRTLRRKGLTHGRNPWKRWHGTFARPPAEKPGDLVQIDTIHVSFRGKAIFYIYTLIDLFSRFAYAKVVWHINTYESLQFVRETQKAAGFPFRVIQSDHGPEFSSWFTEQVGVMKIAHRHSRVRQSNDNAHIERFNRTIQEEALDRIPKDFKAYQKAVRQYLRYYNGERIHMGIDFLTPLQKIAETIPSY
jgi:transposase InsO family protein